MSELQTTTAIEQTVTKETEKRSERTRKRKQRIAVTNIIMFWLLLIMGGLYGAYSYMNHVEQKLTAQIEKKTEERIQEMQIAYNQKISDLDVQYTAQMDDLNSQIASLNELLTFVKDNANTDQDDSNKLYTQISEIKAQLQKLQNSMELLK